MPTLSLTPRPVAGSAASADPAITLLGPSAAMAQLWAQVRRLAPHVRTVLLTGSSDAGGEAVARLLLDLSPCPRRSFLVFGPAEAEQVLLRTATLNALPADLLLFLPDVQRLSLPAQNCLVRLLRGRRNRALSVVAASGEDIRALVSMGRFSGELADLLGSVRIPVPALRDRLEDMPMLFGQLLAARCRDAGRPAPQLTEGFLRAAAEHTWPGNLRELSLLIDNLLTGEEITELVAADFERALASQHVPQAELPAVRMIKLDTVIQEHLYSVLSGCHGNKLRAAEVLGISRSTLYRMLEAAAGEAPLSLAS